MNTMTKMPMIEGKARYELHVAECNSLLDFESFHQRVYPGMNKVFPLFRAFNERFFGEGVQPTPIIHGILPYGHCVGQTRFPPGVEPHIILATRIMGDAQEWAGTLLHEMLHAYLKALGEPIKHNARPWCREIQRISQSMGITICATPQIVKRIDGKATRWTPPDALKRTDLARWPHSLPEWSAAFKTLVEPILNQIG
jgi:hypothetical protein